MAAKSNNQASNQSRHRRPHRKSRNGCKACKARRTKCDEQGPPCVNCLIRKTECVYDANHPHHSQQLLQIQQINQTHDLSSNGLSPTISPPPLASSPSTVTTNPPQQRNTLELELLFQWTTETAATMGSDEKDRHVWRIEVTKESFRFEPLINAIFAVSAAHIAEGMTPSNPDRPQYINASLEYYTKCCELFRDELINLKRENFAAMLQCAIILLVLRLYVPRYEADDEPCVNRVLAAFELLQGTWSIAHLNHDESEGPLDTDYLLRHFEPKALDVETTNVISRLRKINEQNLGDYLCHRQPCDKAIDLLEQWWARSHQGNQGPSLVWLLVIPRDFVSLIRCGDPIAQLILLHWSVLFQKSCGDQKWCSQFIGRRLVDELSVALAGSDNIDLQACLIWADQTIDKT